MSLGGIAGEREGERPDWESEKLARRQAVAASHRIVLNIGDDLADFLPGVRRATNASRSNVTCSIQHLGPNTGVPCTSWET